MSSSGGIGSYSTAMVASASCSAARDSAATRATASPTCRTSPSASTGQSGWIIGMRFLPGMSAAVSTACTPAMRARRRHVDAGDAGVGVGRAQHPADEGAGRGQVLDVEGGALHLVRGVRAADALADDHAGERIRG